MYFYKKIFRILAFSVTKNEQIDLKKIIPSVGDDNCTYFGLRMISFLGVLGAGTGICFGSCAKVYECLGICVLFYFNQ